MSAYVKALIGGGLIFGLGYWLMKTTAPDPNELYKVSSEKLSPDLQEQVKSPETRKKNEQLMEILKRAAETNKTIYDVNQIVDEMKEERKDKR
ncbi:13646_t:CDS:2 [Funneliformis geosporum]|uniref:16961_t:CDS:1 n=1 Tax=Funneliformis geosporum TaxID=1117311 RepID=A0A9W4SR38_9GLOM|nr:13646_t:CDS:2 [Funneliformis geosporum]CAI2178532.1 16961_t:CDS:2 [Funneliformis geosporum]